MTLESVILSFLTHQYNTLAYTLDNIAQCVTFNKLVNLRLAVHHVGFQDKTILHSSKAQLLQ